MYVRSGVLSALPSKQLTLCGREIKKKNNDKSTTMAFQLLEVCKKVIEAGLTQFPGAWINFMENVSRCCFILPFFRPRTVSPIALMPVRSPGRRGCRLRKFFCEIFSPISAKDTVALKDQADYANVCLSNFWIKGIPNSCRDCFCFSTNAFFAS